MTDDTVIINFDEGEIIIKENLPKPSDTISALVEMNLNKILNRVRIDKHKIKSEFPETEYEYRTNSIWVEASLRIK